MFYAKCLFLAKLLVSTGSPVDNGVVSEVLDLQNATNICTPMADFPIKTSQVESIAYSNFRSGYQIKKVTIIIFLHTFCAAHRNQLFIFIV